MSKVIDLNKRKVVRKRRTPEEKINYSLEKREKINQELKQLDFKNETTVTKNLNKIAIKINKMLDLAYKQYIYKPGMGNSNAFVALTNSLQNIMANLRQLKNTQEQVDEIMKIVTRHHMQALLQFQNMFVPLREGLPNRNKKMLNDAVTTYGKYLTESSEHVRKELTKLIG